MFYTIVIDVKYTAIFKKKSLANIFWQNIINSCQLWKKRKNEIKY